MQEITEIPIGKIKTGEHEQRIELDGEEIDALASSIARLGLLYPLLVSPDGEEYILIEGHRRLAACRQMGMEKVRCMIQVTGSHGIAEIAFAGNFFHKDLSPVELAGAMKDCLKKGAMSIKEMALGFHRSEHWVQKMIAVADWPGEILEAIHEGAMSVSAAANLAMVSEGTYRSFLLRSAVEQGATARTTAAWLQAFQEMQPAEEAVTAEPVGGRPVPQPAVPQAPCLCCGQVYLVNEMSHVPVCGGCIQLIRHAGPSGGEQLAQPKQ